MSLTERSLELFLALARDQGNWGTDVPLDHNVPFSKEDRGNLTDLKRKRLVTTFEYEAATWVRFTEEGKALAGEHGVDVETYIPIGERE